MDMTRDLLDVAAAAQLASRLLGKRAERVKADTFATLRELSETSMRVCRHLQRSPTIDRRRLAAHSSAAIRFLPMRGGASHMLLECRIERKRSVRVVRVRGDIDLNTIGLFEDILQAALDGEQPLVIDLSRLEYIDSHGVHAISELCQRSLGRKIAVAVASPSATVCRLLAAVEMDRWLRVFPDVRTAVQNLAMA